MTQDRLFQACAKLDAAANIPPPPPPLPPTQPDDNQPTDDGSAIGIFTNFDPEKGYPPIQCASAELAKLLKDSTGNGDEIGICGEVCVPIPQGMTQTQVEATGVNINWCLNCTMIGTDQMICASDPENGG